MSAYTLLLLALQLLTAVVQNPTLPASIRNQAVSIGNQAIVAAQQQITLDNATSTPVLGGISIIQSTSTPSTFSTQSTTTLQQIATTPVLVVTIPNMTNDISFTGWDDSKNAVVIPNGSTTLTVFDASGNHVATTTILIYDSYGHTLVNSFTDQQGQFIFDAGKTLGGMQVLRFVVPAINLDKKVNFLI